LEQHRYVVLPEDESRWCHSCDTGLCSGCGRLVFWDVGTDQHWHLDDSAQCFLIQRTEPSASVRRQAPGGTVFATYGEKINVVDSSGDDVEIPLKDLVWFVSRLFDSAVSSLTSASSSGAPRATKGDRQHDVDDDTPGERPHT